MTLSIERVEVSGVAMPLVGTFTSGGIPRMRSGKVRFFVAENEEAA